MLLYVALGAAALALVFAFTLFGKIMRQDAGTEKMQAISKKVQEGAAAFLRAEYRWLAVFVAIVAVVIGVGLDWRTAIAFTCGALASGIAGYIGMHTATRAAVRTTQAATKGLAPALGVAFSSGAVMGMSVVGLALLGISIFTLLYGTETVYTADAVNQVLGFSFGASSIALFARVGGGIFTKAADVGADLVGKIEAGIPEDDPRNPGTIADNVGDNVGDVAGMGADLFESYAGSIIATMALGAAVYGGSPAMVLLPLIIAAIGIVASIIGTFFVKANNEHALHSALFRGLLIASAIVVAGAFVATWTDVLSGIGLAFPEGVEPKNAFWAIVAGLLVGVAVGKLTEYYTGSGTKPVVNIAKQSETGSATNIIHGLATGMESVALPLITICIGIAVAYYMGNPGGENGGVYGVAIAAVGMLSTLGISLGVDAYGPVADNAGGLAEMAELPKEVRQRTDALDAVGNTTAAIGKGFAIGSAALTALALFSAFSTTARHLGEKLPHFTFDLDITNTEVVIGLLLGGMLPFLFSAMTMRAVGNAANKMVEEIRRQFREIPGLMEGKAEPDAARCVEISTAGSLKQMVLPGVLAIAAPIAIGFWSVNALGGLLAGALVSGVMMAIFMSNAGGAWDNAKKYIETSGAHGGKGSDTHKAAVVGDTVGDPFKDTSGPSLNILVKLMTVVGLVFLPLFLRA
ncbi:MAG: sodium-translocating pyrophosphatase [Planctomycetota bacterium]